MLSYDPNYCLFYSITGALLLLETQDTLSYIAETTVFINDTTKYVHQDVEQNVLCSDCFTCKRVTNISISPKLSLTWYHCSRDDLSKQILTRRLLRPRRCHIRSTQINIKLLPVKLPIIILQHLPRHPRQSPYLFYPMYVVKLPVLGIIRKGIHLINDLTHSLVKFMVFWLFKWYLKIEVINMVPARLGITFVKALILK